MNRQLVQLPGHCTYVALSYVWGQDPNGMRQHTTMSTVMQYQKNLGLSECRIPPSVEDAIEICIQLDQRYLWVDQLCIVQDDDKDKKRQIEGMASIYAKAYFTLILAHSGNMNAHVPGVRSDRLLNTAICSVGGFRIRAGLPGFRRDVQKSTWASRGWTYQENVLSTRKLYMMPDQAVWACHQNTIEEKDPVFLYTGDSSRQEFFMGVQQGFELPVAARPPSQDHWAITFKHYGYHSSGYNRRTLAFVSDIYHAFKGISYALYPNGPTSETFLFNLPIQDLDQALLWYIPSDVPYAPRASTTVPLPSWSWSSMASASKYLDCYGSLVQWTWVSKDKQPTRLNGSRAGLLFWLWRNQIASRPFADQRQQLLIGAPDIHMALAIGEGCIERTDQGTMIEELGHLSFVETSKKLREKWPDYASYWIDAIQVHKPSKALARTHIDHLQTRAQMAHVKLALHRPHGVIISCRHELYTILSPQGASIGLLTPSPILDLAQIQLDWSNTSFEVIALSIGGLCEGLECCLEENVRGTHPRLDYAQENHQSEKDCDGDDIFCLNLYDPGVMEKLDITYKDANGVSLHPAPVVNVMLLGERDGFHYRISVGWVFLKRWVEMERTFEDIMLV